VETHSVVSFPNHKVDRYSAIQAEVSQRRQRADLIEAKLGIQTKSEAAATTLIANTNQDKSEISGKLRGMYQQGISTLDNAEPETFQVAIETKSGVELEAPTEVTSDKYGEIRAGVAERSRRADALEARLQALKR